MKYDFETVIDRSLKGSSKWEGMKQVAKDIPEGIVPLSVADADIKLAPEIQQGMIDFLNNDPVLGYTCGTDRFFDSIVQWLAKKHHYHIDKEWIVISDGIVPALNDGVRAFTKENEGVIILTPVYYPFYNCIKLNHRVVKTCSLIYQDLTYHIDFDAFEKLAKDPNNTLFILCSPHNPVGRVWKQEELIKLANICLENNVLIMSDEIHQDLTMPGHIHYPLASLSDEIADITITCGAPSKSFNLAGMQGSHIVIKNEKLREKFKQQQDNRSFFTLNALAFESTYLAYTKAEEWLDGFKELIAHNYDVLCQYIQDNLPKIKVCDLQGTYLVWLDFNEYGYSYEELEIMMKKAYLYLDEGYIFGQEGEGFERINIACPTHVLVAALERLKGALA